MTTFSSAATVTISIPANPAFIPIVSNIGANSTLTVDLSPWLNLVQNAPANTTLNKGILITATADITAYYEVVSSYCDCNPEVFALKGKNALGNEFYISSQYTYNIDTIRQPIATTSFDIVATQDNTNITIIPTKSITGHAANIPFSIVLNRGQTYSATGVYRDLNNHLEGSYVTSDNPIAVTLKDDLVFGDGPCADLIGDQTIPTNVLGNEYIVAKGFLVPKDRVFVLAADDNASVFLDGSPTPSVLLNKGQSWTFNLANPSTYIQSDKRIYVYQVTGDGCELGSAIIPKLNCTGSINISIVRSTNDNFGIMLVTKTINLTGFSVNGNTSAISPANFLPVPGTAGVYSAATIDMSGFLPAGNVFNITNSLGKFSMGFINGGVGNGSRYGYFSDFKSSNVQSSQVDVCKKDSVQINAFGGASYQWSPAKGLSDVAIANPKASPDTTTSYKVIITDAEGCIDSAFVKVIVDTVPQPDFTFDQTVCSPLEARFAGISQANATYDWYINDGSSYLNNQNPVHDFTQYGIYQVKLKMTIPAGCSDSITKTVTIQSVPGHTINTADTTVCSGRSLALNAMPALEYCWSPTSSLDNPSSSSPVATPLVTTKYYLISKTVGKNLIANGDFNNGNTGFTSAYIYDQINNTEGEYFVGPSPHNWNPNAPVSCGDHTTGSGNMMILNGSPSFGVNVWQQQIVVSPNTNYAFSTWIQSISPFSPAILQFSMNGIPLGSAINASANTCLWQQFSTVWNSGSNTTVTISLVNENTAVLGNDFALDDISFAPVTMLVDSVTITVDKPAVLSSPDVSVCPGVPVQLSAEGALTYSWSPAPGLSDTSIANPIAQPAVTSSYIVTGTTENGCTAKDTVVVALYAPTVAILTPDTSVCLGSSIQLRATGGNSYIWSPTQYLDNPGIASPAASPAVTTKFFLKSLDLNNCTDVDSITVDIRPIPIFHKPDDQPICKGSSTVLKSANDPKDNYAWSPSAGLNDPNSPAPVASPQSTTVYTLQISDGICTSYDSVFSVTVSLRPSPIVVARKANDITCTLPTAQLTASGASSYVWVPAEGLNDPNLPNPLARIDSTTSFIVQGTDSNGCSANDTLTVFVTATGKNLFVVPNAFTPNGDGHNDCFGVGRWGGVTLEEFSVYNRTGQRIFTTRNPSECWDGSFRGRPQGAGAYAYVVKALSFCGQITRTGIVMLVR